VHHGPHCPGQRIQRHRRLQHPVSPRAGTSAEAPYGRSDQVFARTRFRPVSTGRREPRPRP
jgi:hypothetical protein